MRTTIFDTGVPVGVTTQDSNMSVSRWSAVMAAEDLPQLPQLLVKRAEAAAMLGMSIDSFERYIEPQLKLVLVGAMRLVPVEELKRFVHENAIRCGVPR